MNALGFSEFVQGIEDEDFDEAKLTWILNKMQRRLEREREALEKSTHPSIIISLQKAVELTAAKIEYLQNELNQSRSVTSYLL